LVLADFIDEPLLGIKSDPNDFLDGPKSGPIDGLLKDISILWHRLDLIVLTLVLILRGNDFYWHEKGSCN